MDDDIRKKAISAVERAFALTDYSIHNINLENNINL
jgi:hypothetical protein